MQRLLKKFWSNKFLKGGLFYTASSFLVNLMNYLFNLIAGRSLGPQGYGELTALFSYLTLATVPTVVFSNFVIQKIAGTADSVAVAKSIENLFWEKIKRWATLFILLLFGSPILAKLTNLSLFLSFTLLLLIYLTVISSIYGSLLQGLQLFFIYSLIGAVGTLIKLLGALAVLSGLDGIVTIISFIFISSLIGIIYSFKIVRDHIHSKYKKIKDVPKIERRIIHLLKNPQFILIFLSIFALTLFNNADIAFVKKYFAPLEAGIYSSWALFAKIILYSLGPFIAISFIFFSGQQSDRTERKTLHFSLLSLIALGIVSFFAYKYLTFPIINIFFGQKFYSVSPFLTKASIFGTLYTGIAFLNNFFLAKKSRVCLVLPFSVFFYAISLFFIEKELSAIMNLNILFSALVLIIYLVLYFKFFLTNPKKGYII